MTSADSRSTAATHASTATRHEAREHDLRQVAREVPLEPSTPWTAAAATSPPSAPSSAAGCERSRRSTSSSRSSESTCVAARRPATSNPHASTPRPAKASASRTSSALHLGEPGAVERLRDDRREQRRLERGRARPWRARSPCRRRAGSSPAARGARGAGRSRASAQAVGEPPVFRASASTGDSTSSPVTRARKT